MPILLLSTLLLFSLSCGDSDGDTTNDDQATTKIIPEGFVRVSAARINHAGTRIAMVAEKNENPVLITTALDGTEIEELSAEGLSYLTTLAWSSDDNQIYFSGDGITKIPAANGVIEKVVDAFAVASFDISPDEKMIAWATNGGTSLRIAPLSTLPVSNADVVDLAGAKEPRFSPDSKKLLTIVGAAFTTMDIDGTNSVTHTEGASHLSNGAWIDDSTFLFLGNDSISEFNINSKETRVVDGDGFAATSLDYNATAGKYTYRVNGQQDLFVRSF